MEDPKITKEDIERLKSRDARWKDIDIAIKVDEELRDSVALNLILEAATRWADEALEQLAVVNPSDTAAVIGYQARVRCARFIAETLAGIRQRGLNSAAALDEEGKVEL